MYVFVCVFFFFKQKTADEMRISDWSSDVCSSDLTPPATVATGCSLANATNLSLASIAASPARSTIVVRPRSALRAWPSATFFLSCEIGRASCRGKSVSVRVDLGGRRILKKKTNTITIKTEKSEVKQKQQHK